jgi:membrane protein
MQGLHCGGTERCREPYTGNRNDMKKLIIDYIKGMIKTYQKDQVALYAAQSTLFIMMSLIPFLMVLIYLIRLLNLDESVIMGLINNYAPDFLKNNIASLIDTLFTRSYAIFSISLLSVLWSAGKALQGIQYGLNNVRKIEDERNWFYLRFRSILSTIILLFVIFFIIVFVVYGGEISELFRAASPTGRRPFALTLIMIFRFPIMIVMMVTFFTEIYTLLPNKKTSFKEQLPSGVACTIAWTVFTIALAILTGYFGLFSIYGSLMMVLLSMFWLYMCMIIFFVCAEIQPMLHYMWIYYRLRRTDKDAVLDLPVPYEVLRVCAIGRK